jgi:acyl carrier protein
MQANKIRKTSRTEIIEQIRRLLEPWVLDADLINKADEKTNLIADLGLDSVSILQLILEIEKKFSISIKNHELDSRTFSMIGNLVRLIERKIYEIN